MAFKIKTGKRVPGKELKGLRTLKNGSVTGSRPGVALATGRRSYTYDDRIHVLPLDRLWRLVSDAPP